MNNLNSRAGIKELANKALTEADATSFDRLMRLLENPSDPSSETYIRGELSRISSQWREESHSRISGDDFAIGARLDCEKGSGLKCATSELISVLLNSKNWRKRYRALIYMRGRKENVSDALNKALNNESNLDVRVKIKESINGRTRLTWNSFGEIIDNLSKK